MIQGEFMKKLIFLFTLSLLLVSMAWGATYSENFDTDGNWAGGSMASYNAKTYTNTSDPSNDGFSSDNAVRESSETYSSGYAWRLASGAYYFRYECEETVSGFSMYLARWDNSPVPGFTVRYSTDSGSTYTDIESLTGAWFTSDKAYKQYTYTFSSPISPSSGNKVYIEINKTTGERLLIDDFALDYGSSTNPTISVLPTSLSDFNYEHGNGPSEAQSFTVTGSNLTGNLSVSSVGTKYVVSATESGTYGTSLSLTQSGGSVSATVYVKLNSGLAIGNYNSQDITVSGGGATSQTVSCSGEVTTPAAPSAPLATAATVLGSDSFTANWDSVSGATGYRLDVYEKEVGATATDLFFSEYIEGGSYNKAIEIFNGTGSPVNLSNYSVKASFNLQPFTTTMTLPDIELADGDVYVIAHESANAAILAVADVTNSNLANFNGDDAVGLFKNDVLIDIIGVESEDLGSGWNVAGVTDATANKTLVRKSSVQAGNTDWAAQAGTNADNSEWIVYAQDTSTYLGSHTFAGGSTLTYVTGFNDGDVSNVTSFEVTNLDPETTYYYVVRAYDAYSQTSSSSNEIEVTTTAASTYDYPEDTEIDAGDELIKITGGNGIIVSGTPTPVPNPGFTPTFEQRIELTGDGPWIVTVFSLDQWVACLFDGTWIVEEVDGTGYVYLWLEFAKSKNTVIELKSGNGGNPTLPVELSTFTATISSIHNAVLTWVTETETNVNGFYIYRNMENNLESALMVSNLIPATNTSTQQVYQFTDKELGQHGTYYYWLQVSDMDGSESFYGPVNVVYDYDDNFIPEIPQKTELSKLYPNPFNPSTTISFALAEDQLVDVNIYNNRGQRVRSFALGQKSAGNHTLIWDGRDDNGKAVTTGIYFIRMSAGGESFHKKAVLMK
jgi:hypothetical protein